MSSKQKLFLLITLALFPSVAEAQFNEKWISFTEEPGRISAGLISDPSTEVHLAWGDLNQDGELDLVVARKAPFMTTVKKRNMLLLNINGVLTDVTASYAVASDVSGDHGFFTPTNDRSVIVEDLDADGWQDVITTADLSDGDPKHISHPRIYRNLGVNAAVWQGIRYEDSRVPQILHAVWTYPISPRFTAVAAGDVDGDGDQDLYFVDQDIDPGVFAPPQPPSADGDDRLLINDGFGYFTDQSQSSLTAAMLKSVFANSTAIRDFNGDGYQDILKQDGYEVHQAFIAYNDPNQPGVFASQQSFYSGNPYYASAGDLNQDGRPDVVLSDNQTDTYLFNMQTAPSGEVVWSAPTPFTFLQGDDGTLAANSRIVDLDGDNWNDVLITNIDPEIDSPGRRMHIYRNLGGTVGGTDIILREDRASTYSGWIGAHGIQLTDLKETYDVAPFDVDGDGRLDLVVSREAGTTVWRQIDPPHCQTDLGFGDGSPVLELCGGDLSSGNPATLLLINARKNASGWLLVSLSSNPTYVPEVDSILAALPPVAMLPFVTSATGDFSLTVPGGGGPIQAVIQVAVLDGPKWAASNALQIQLLP